MKSIIRSLIICLVTFGVHFSVLPVFATDVGGIINTDTVWNLAGSPYNITENVQIASGVTLTIDPGVIVNAVGEKRFEIWGVLNAIGTVASNIIFNNLGLYERSNSTAIHIQFAEINQGKSFHFCSEGGSFFIRDSIINSLDEIEAGCQIGSYIERNTFVGSGVIDHVRGVEIRNNVFYDQTAPIKIEGTSAIVSNNSFLSTDRIALYMREYSDGNFSAIDNFWNTTDKSVIESMIWDSHDDLNIAHYIIYDPALTQPHPDTPIPDFNQSPSADAGTDQVIFNQVTLDGTQSSDPDGELVSYVWNLQHRDNPAFDRAAEGENPTVSNLEPGFYEVSLTVTDDLGSVDVDSMLLAVAGACETWPQANTPLSIRDFKITDKEVNETGTIKITGTVEMPDMNLMDGEAVNSRTTIELFGVMPDGSDLVLSDDLMLNVDLKKKKMVISE